MTILLVTDEGDLPQNVHVLNNKNKTTDIGLIKNLLNKNTVITVESPLKQLGINKLKTSYKTDGPENSKISSKLLIILYHNKRVSHILTI